MTGNVLTIFRCDTCGEPLEATALVSMDGRPVMMCESCNDERLGFCWNCGSYPSLRARTGARCEFCPKEDK